MKLKLLAVLATLTAALLLQPVSAHAASQVSVITSASAQLVSITSDTTLLDYGTLGQGVGTSRGPVQITNNGTTPVRLSVMGENATGPNGAVLTLAQTGSPSTDQFALQLYTTRGSPFLSTAWNDWPGNPTLPVTGTESFRVGWWIGWPTAYGSYHATVLIYAWAL